MASIYDKASLVLIPSGSKTSKVYSQKPTNGDGDFTFSRSTAATRVNASGNIEKETENLLLHSNQFDTTWFTNGPTLVGNQSGYDGSSDAWQITKSGAFAYAYIAQYISSGGVQTASFYAKAGSLSRIGILVGGGDNPYVSYDLSSGTILNQRASVIDSTMTDVGGGWYRCTMTFNTTIGDLNIYPDWDQTNTGNLYLQDIQLEQGLVARDYIETTTTAIYGGITDNVPRLDYTDSSCPALLLEPQRTNSVIHSEYLQNALTNGQVDITFTPNYGISPEGVKNSTRIQFADNSAYAYSSVTITTNAVASMYVKGTSGERFRFGLASSAASGGLVHTFSGEWERISNTSSTATQLIISSYGGTALDFEAYGLQLEQDASYATSYIPTYGSAVTRNAELGSVGDYIGSTITFGPTDDFSIFYDGEIFENQVMIIGGGASTLNGGRLWIRDTQIRLDGTTPSVSLMADTNVVVDLNTRFKLLVKRNGATIDFFLDGNKLTTTQWDTDATFVINSLFWSFNNGYIAFGKHNQMLVFPTALTDQEAIALTTI